MKKKNGRILAGVLAVMLCIAGLGIGCQTTSYAEPDMGTPENVTAAPASDTSIRISWSPVENAERYAIYRSYTPGGTYSMITTTGYTGYTHTKRTTGQTLYYKIRAYRTVDGAKVFGGYSETVSATPVLLPPTSLKAVSASYSSIRLSWNAVPGAERYAIYRSYTPGGTYSMITTTGYTGYMHTKRTTGQTLYYKIRAYKTVDGQKVFGEYTGTVSATPVFAGPTSLKAVSASYSSIKLSWTAVPGAQRYLIYRLNPQTGIYSGITTTSGTSYTNTKRTTGRTYYYKVKAYYYSGSTRVYSSSSAAAHAKPVLATPKSFRAAKLSAKSIKASWSAVGGASKYLVYRATSKTGPYSVIAATAKTSYTSTNLPIKKTYYYKVRAVRSVGGTNIYGSVSPVVTVLPLPLEGKVIGLDPGHQRYGNYAKEPNAPGSSVMKYKVSSGTQGRWTRVPEYQVVLDVGLRLKTLLEKKGASVVMTRTTNNVNISNIERAKFFNAKKTDYALRLHCNGSDNPSVHGAFMLVPSKNPYLGACNEAAGILLDEFCASTGAKDLGIMVRSDQTGFNWCERMIINIEMGHMTNRQEDVLLAGSAYQQKMAQGLCNGIVNYFKQQS